MNESYWLSYANNCYLQNLNPQNDILKIKCPTKSSSALLSFSCVIFNQFIETKIRNSFMKKFKKKQFFITLKIKSN